MDYCFLFSRIIAASFYMLISQEESTV
uniref:Uncharacterized protein n=1 Tax=Anguilla anguilla TaxID=7936 RepID=A0A0E9TSD5_ANGAN